MSDPLYAKAILRLAADAHGAGRLVTPHHTGTAHNPTCGDKVIVDLALDDRGTVTAMAHETKACVLSQASASILGQHLAGLDHAAVQNLREAVAAMLAKPPAVPGPPFDSYGAFEGAVTFKNRHTCVLLPIDAVLAAFDAGDF